MVALNGHKQASKAEIGFETFPCEPCATEAGKLLQSLQGMIQITFDPAVERLAVFFDPKGVKIPSILATLQSFGLKPKVVSIASPIDQAAQQ
ncbi:MAG: hypothetical protein HYT78_18540 [Deltaproteobacteria bacterium]|nr:hypothetical protein [Deltaproteobacteria bacterium]